MIDIQKAIDVFEEYINQFDTKDDRIKLKVIHTYEVCKMSVYISKDLGLSKEDVELASIIGLLHDIGRFEQLKRYNTFNDNESTDHANLGVQILKKDNLIRKFVQDDKYDQIILKAIENHNKYKIEEGLSERELLHTKIIRDSDKTDNFRVKEIESIYTLFRISQEEFVKEKISDNIYNTAMSKNCILSSDRITHMDCLVSYMAFIFDFNFASGLKYIKEKDYVNKILNRFDYQDEETKKRIDDVRNCVNHYIEERCGQ